MSLIINGATMPMSCLDCPCLRHDVTEGINSYQCNVTLRTFSRLPGGRSHDCPLTIPDGEIDKELEEFCANTKRCDLCIMKQAFPKCGVHGWHIRYSTGKLNEAAHTILDAVKMIKEEESNEKN